MLSWCLNISLSILRSFGNSKSCWSLAILIFCKKKKKNEFKSYTTCKQKLMNTHKMGTRELVGQWTHFQLSSHRDLIQYELYYNKSHYYYHLIAVIVLRDKNHLIVNGSLIYEHIYVFLSIHVIQDIKKFWEIIFLLL